MIQTIEHSRSTLHCLYMCMVLTPLDIQAPLPILPLSITDMWGGSVHVVGYLASTLAAFSVIGTLCLPSLLSKTSVRKALLSLLSLRLCDSLVFIAAISSPYPYPLFPLLYLSRCMLGVSVAVIGMPSIWIADRICTQDRVTTAAKAQSILTASTVVGPMGGAVLSQFTEAQSQPLALWAWCTLLRTVLILTVWTWCEDDGTIQRKSMSPKKQARNGASADDAYDEDDANDEDDKDDKDDKDGEDGENEKARRTLMCAAWCTFCMMIGTMSGFETLLGMSLHDSYGWDARSSIPYWIAISLFSIAGSGVAASMIGRFGWKACALVCGPAAVCLLMYSFNPLKIQEQLPAWRLAAGAMSALPQVVLFTCLSSSMPLSLLPPHMHAQSMPAVQVCMQLGRGAGPFLASTWYDWATGEWGEKSGYAANSMFSIFFLTLAWAPAMILNTKSKHAITMTID